MKKLLTIAAAVLCVAATLTSCGSKQCNMCKKSCSDKYSYRNGEVVLCGSCYKKCFDNYAEVDPDVFFGEDLPDAETAE